MNHWNDLRRRAQEQRSALRTPVNDASADSLLRAAQEATGVPAFPVPASDPLLDGSEAAFDRKSGLIWYNADADPGMARFYVAHEYAHVWLHAGSCTCGAPDLDPEAAEERPPLGAGRVEGYSARERTEREANVYAREFLLPCPLLRRWFDEGQSASDIAAHVGVPEGMVLHQLSRALLTPALVPARLDEQSSGTDAGDLDDSQRAAAHAPCGPLLLEAGPGTGKTRTLTARITWLLEQGVVPSSILALTYSNKAAEEMRTRVGRASPDAAPSMWMGTFHAFGLELLQKYGERLGMRAPLMVVDGVDALLLLERALPSLPLDHYQNLYEPTRYLREILKAVSRAKDEMVGPAAYMSLADSMRRVAKDPAETLAAEKALEVARVYAAYQELLEDNGLVDFGDLIFKSVLLLREHPEVRARVRADYGHILVDEYQDVNHASGLLLRELAGAGSGLWVVGDVRQSVYRFRGAAPRNMRRFTSDFPGAHVLALTRNYRSQPVIVDAFAALAPQMRAAEGLPFEPWTATRPANGGRVLMEIAANLDAEGVGIAEEIERQRAAGMPYRNQAILCRTHTNLGRIAAILEREGVPVLYLGDVFERPEVRDLLSVLSLACEGDGRALLRIAEFPEYQIPTTDVHALRALARERDIPFPRALRLAAECDQISAAGRAGFARLERHLDEICYGSSAWGMLVRYLFNRSEYLRSLLQDDSTAGQQRRLAIYQFLHFAHGQRHRAVDAGLDPKKSFLSYVRRLAASGDDRELRQIPEWAAGIDAVRILTVHASKGLEFDAVYLPILGKGHFPLRRRGGTSCPPPVDMLPAEALDPHEEEEECLFFVALSRARDVLCLSRAMRYGATSSNPSDLLDRIQAVLPRRPNAPVSWPGNPVPDAPVASVQPPHDLETYDVRALDVYIQCPRKYHYEFVLRLGGKRDDSAYIQFHRCVYRVLRWIHEEQAANRPISRSAAHAMLAGAWAEQGPVGHAYEAVYRRTAEGMLDRALDRVPASMRRSIEAEWEVTLTHGRVRLIPDQIEVDHGTDSSPVVRRWRTGRPSASETDKDIYALYRVAARAAYPDKDHQVEVVYLSTDEVQPLEMTEKKMSTRLARYDAAMMGIQAGSFPATPDEHECPRCPHWFVCPVSL